MKILFTAYDNVLEAFIPELWSREAVALTVENMVAANLVHRDFEPDFARFGQTVHTRQPAHFEAVNKHKGDTITKQDATASDIEVKLNQHPHVSFVIDDQDETLSFESLVERYMEPAAIALANRIDRIVLGQYAQFLHNQAGALGGLSSSNGVQYITETTKVMNDNLAPVQQRRLLLGTTAQMYLTQNAVFHEADKVGDEGTALREASLGRKLGFDTYMDQNLPTLLSAATTIDGAVNGAHAKGATVITVDGFAMSEVLLNRWVTIDGRAYYVTAVNADPVTQITLSYGLTAAVDNDAVVVGYPVGAVNEPLDYAAGWSKAIVVDGFSAGDLVRGQLISFGSTLNRYVIVKTNGITSIELDRPLDVGIGDGDNVAIGPNGDINFAFHRNAMTLAIRPLKPVMRGAGGVSGVANFGGMTVRTTVSYDHDLQQHVVTMDLLAGIKPLDLDLGAVMFS